MNPWRRTARSSHGIILSRNCASAKPGAIHCEVEPRAYLLAAVRAALETPRPVLLPHDRRV